MIIDLYTPYGVYKICAIQGKHANITYTVIMTLRFGLVITTCYHRYLLHPCRPPQNPTINTYTLPFIFIKTLQCHGHVRGSLTIVWRM